MVAQIPSLRLYLFMTVGVVCIGIFIATSATSRSALAVFDLAPRRDSPGVITHIEWEDTPRFADEIVHRGVPALITGSPVSDWTALQTWTLSSLAAQPALQEVINVKVGDVPVFKHTDHAAPLWPVIDFRMPYTERNLTSRSYFKKLRDAPAKGEYLYYSPGISDERLLGDVEPREPFLLGANDTFVGLWIASAGVIANTHHDSYSNFFVQIVGRKRFTLFPPSMWRSMYLYPRLHPHARNAQVDVTAPDASRFPRFDADRAEQEHIEVELSPGDVLYLPEYWFHRVESIDTSVSVNLWTPSPQFLLVEEARALPLPFEWEWPDSTRVAASAYYLTRLIETLFGENMAPGFVASHVAARYQAVMNSAGENAFPRVTRLCSERGSVFASAEPLDAALTAKIEEYADRVAALFARAPEDTRGLHVANFLEDLALWSVGPELVSHYVTCCFQRIRSAEG